MFGVDVLAFHLDARILIQNISCSNPPYPSSPTFAFFPLTPFGIAGSGGTVSPSGTTVTGSSFPMLALDLRFCSREACRFKVLRDAEDLTRLMLRSGSASEGEVRRSRSPSLSVGMGLYSKSSMVVALRFLVILPVEWGSGVDLSIGSGAGLKAGPGAGVEIDSRTGSGTGVTESWVVRSFSLWLVVGVGGRMAGRGGTGGTSLCSTECSSLRAEASLNSRSETRFDSFFCFCRSFLLGVRYSVGVRGGRTGVCASAAA